MLKNEKCLWNFSKHEFHFTSYFILCPKATAEANNLAAVATAKDTYNKKMEEVRNNILNDVLTKISISSMNSFFLSSKLYSIHMQRGGFDFSVFVYHIYICLPKIF